MVISRSGRSVEIVQLLAKAKKCGAVVVGITNSDSGPLALQSQIPLVIDVKFDHGMSVNTYTTLALAAGALASTTLGSFDNTLVTTLSRAVAKTDQCIRGWQQQIADSAWPLPGSTCYFLARGSSLGSCYEARLLWEEGVKSPATTMGTGSFRHGPQEIVKENVRFGLWLDGRQMRAQDLAVARDLRWLRASVMLIGQDLAEDAGDLVFRLPEIPAEWQFLIDIIPVQIAAEKVSRLSGVDCDKFRLCPYIVEDDGDY